MRWRSAVTACLAQSHRSAASRSSRDGWRLPGSSCATEGIPGPRFVLELLDMPDTGIEMLRHTVATVAYRGAKALRGAPADFAAFRAAPNTRTPGEILAHIGDL